MLQEAKPLSMQKENSITFLNDFARKYPRPVLKGRDIITKSN